MTTTDDSEQQTRFVDLAGDSPGSITAADIGGGKGQQHPGPGAGPDHRQVR